MSVYFEKTYGENSSDTAFYYVILSVQEIGRDYIFKLDLRIASWASSSSHVEARDYSAPHPTQ